MKIVRMTMEDKCEAYGLRMDLSAVIQRGLTLTSQVYH